jgi:hypothetical protein
LIRPIVKSSGFCGIGPIPACFSEQGGSHRQGGASALQSNGDFPMATKQPRAAKQCATVKKQKYTTIVEEVEKFEDLVPRMHELLLIEPEGTRIYLRVRDRRTIN